MRVVAGVDHCPATNHAPARLSTGASLSTSPTILDGFPTAKGLTLSRGMDTLPGLFSLLLARRDNGPTNSALRGNPTPMSWRAKPATAADPMTRC